MKKTISMVIIAFLLQAILAIASSGVLTEGWSRPSDHSTMFSEKVVPEIDTKGGLWYDDFQDLKGVNLSGGLTKVTEGISIDMTFDDFEQHSNNTDLIGENGWVFHNLYALGSFIADNRTGYDNSSKMFARTMNPDKVKNQIVLSRAFDIVNGSLRAYVRTNHIYPDEKVSSRFHLLGTRSTSPTLTTDVIMALGFNNGGLSVLSTGNWYQLTKNVQPNKWYMIDLDWNGLEKEFDIKVTTINGTLLAEMKDLNYRNPLGSTMRFSLTTGFKLTTQTHMETCLDGVQIKDNDLVKNNTALSSIISLPQGCRWTTLRIDHKNAPASYTEFELLGAGGRSLMNFFVGPDQCEAELNYLNNEGVREVRFSYTCFVASFDAPVLMGWGLEWEAQDTWKDSFLTQRRTNGNTTACFIKGSYTLNASRTEGVVNSRIVVRPDRYYWRTFEYDGYPGFDGTIAVDILDGLTGDPIPPFTDLVPGSYDISSIDYEEHQYLSLSAKLGSNTSKPILRSWSLRWSDNNLPHIIAVTGPKYVLRSYPCIISVSAIDPERDPSTLKVHLAYVRPITNETMTTELTGPIYNGTKKTWDFTLTPLENAPLGAYSFVSYCVDEVGYESTEAVFRDVVEVKNNPPRPPIFELIPRNPTTIDELRTVVTVKANDREGEALTYTYRWLLKGKELKAYSMINDTRFSPSLPSNVHKKGDVIRLEVKVTDGKDWSETFAAQTVILNSHVKVVQNYPSSITLQEDSTDERQLDLSKFFYDEDNDQLTFESRKLLHSLVSVSENGSVSIVPDPDWYGMERMVFNASDGSTTASLGIDLIVQSVNDEPVARLLAPISGLVHVRVGEGVVFRAEGSDKDNDELTFTWKDGDVHLGAGERITLNWTTPGLRTIDCHVSDGYVDLVYAKVLVNVTKRPVMPGSGTNESGIGGLSRAADNRLAFYILPAVALVLIAVLVILAFVVARNKARKENGNQSLEPVQEPYVYGNDMDHGLSDDLQILGFEPVPVDEGIPQQEIEALPPAAIDMNDDEPPTLTEEGEDEEVEQQAHPGDDEGAIDVPSMDSVDLQAELDSIESTLSEMLAPKDG